MRGAFLLLLLAGLSAFLEASPVVRCDNEVVPQPDVKVLLPVPAEKRRLYEQPPLRLCSHCMCQDSRPKQPQPSHCDVCCSANDVSRLVESGQRGSRVKRSVVVSWFNQQWSKIKDLFKRARERYEAKHHKA